MEMYKDIPLIPFETFDEWIKWLEVNHASSKGMWVKFAKKSSGTRSITYEEAREGALMYGWIDGQKGAVDGTYYAIRFTPRRPKSPWSKINREIAETLLVQGKVTPAGIIQIDAAKRDGRWEAAYESQAKITIPDDFLEALNEHPKAKEFFESINSANRYAFLYRIHTAKKAETRASRIEKFIDMLNNGEVFHPNR